MVGLIGVIASTSQGVSYFERDGYYVRDDPAHRDGSSWAGKGAEALGLSGPVDSATLRAILEGKVPGGPQLGRRGHSQKGNSGFRSRDGFNLLRVDVGLTCRYQQAFAGACHRDI